MKFLPKLREPRPTRVKSPTSKLLCSKDTSVVKSLKSSSLKELTAASQAARSVNVVKFAASAMPADKVLNTAMEAKLFTVYDRKKFRAFFLFT